MPPSTRETPAPVYAHEVPTPPCPATRLVSTGHLVGKMDKIHVGGGRGPEKKEPALMTLQCPERAARGGGGGLWLERLQTLVVLTRGPDLRVFLGEWTAIE